jgi:carboxymethylenebutenolidase
MADAIQSGWIELGAADGHCLDALELKPAGAPRGSVVLLQEIFGVNSHIQSVGRRLAEQGYAVVAPALFDRVRKKVQLGYDADCISQGRALLAAMATDTALMDVACAMDHAKGAGPTFVLGFCWGGSLAWLAAGKLKPAGVVAFYGGQIGAHLDRPLPCPAMTHFGDQDASIPLEVAHAVSRQSPATINHIYRAGHGFHCDDRGSFDASASALAWRRTLSFLDAIC